MKTQTGRFQVFPTDQGYEVSLGGDRHYRAPTLYHVELALQHWSKEERHRTEDTMLRESCPLCLAGR